MAKITWTYQAKFWLKEIYDYIAIDNPFAAADVITAAMQKRNS